MIVVKREKQEVFVNKVRKICDKCSDEYHMKYESSEIIIEAKLGTVYQGDDFRDGYYLDICPKCFANGLKQVIEEYVGKSFHEYNCCDTKAQAAIYSIEDGEKFEHDEKCELKRLMED